jgi:methionyl-tRNA formyltransferase
MPPRIVFFGYSEVGHDCLSLLVERADNVVALITHADNPQENVWFRTPATLAYAHRIPVFTPENVNCPDWIARLGELEPDLILSAYYRHLISPKILNLARLGAFNLHGSLLPKYRGRAPINWAVLHGESRIGMTLHRMVRRPDAGAIVDQDAVELGPRDAALEAYRKVLPCARRVLGRQIDALLAGTATEIPQEDSQATYFGARGPEDGRIVWTQTSQQIFNLIRAVTDPYPGAFIDIDGARLMVWWAEMDSDAVRNFVATRVEGTMRPMGGQSVGAGANVTLSGRVPGEIVSVSPLVVATVDGALELTKTEWRGGLHRELRVGQRL